MEHRAAEWERVGDMIAGLDFGSHQSRSFMVFRGMARLSMDTQSGFGPPEKTGYLGQLSGLVIPP